MEHDVKLGLMVHCLRELLKHRDHLMPAFIGAFSGIEGLPKEMTYPPCYWWICGDEGVVISWNDPLLRNTISQIAAHLKIPISVTEIDDVRRRYIECIDPHARHYVAMCMQDLRG